MAIGYSHAMHATDATFSHDDITAPGMRRDAVIRLPPETQRLISTPHDVACRLDVHSVRFTAWHEIARVVL